MTGNFQLQSLESRTMFNAVADTVVQQSDAASLQPASAIQMSQLPRDFGNTTLDSSGNGSRTGQFTGNSVEARRNDTPVS